MRVIDIVALVFYAGSAFGRQCRPRLNDSYSTEPSRSTSESSPSTTSLPTVSSRINVAAVTAATTSAIATPATSPKPSTSLGSTSGRATFYGGNWSGGKCSFADYNQGSFLGTAIGASEWRGSVACGSCLRVTGPSGTADVMVVDQCPECEAGHLDLFQNVANMVNAKAATDGIFAITWEQIPCAVSGNIQFKNKEGTSGYYFALQVRNSVQPIETLEVSKDSGVSWIKVERFDYNYFTSYSGFGDRVDVRVTASNGQQIIHKNLDVSSGTIVAGNSQFSK